MIIAVVNAIFKPEKISGFNGIWTHAWVQIPLKPDFFSGLKIAFLNSLLPRVPYICVFVPSNFQLLIIIII